MGDISTHFDRREFACKCGCGFDDISMDLVTRLENMRVFYGKPITVSSGCRCPEHNRKVGGKSNSAHLRGTAADIKVHDPHSSDRFELTHLSLSQGIARIGVSKDFLHVDVDEEAPSPRLWTY